MKEAYLTELHLHTKESSSCSNIPAKEMIEAYNKKGYSTIVITDHCSKGKMERLGNISWKQKMNYVFTGFDIAKEYDGKALSSSDKDVIVNDILGGLATVADAPIAPDTWGYASTMKYECDVEKAKELLAEAGYPDGIELELWTPVGRYLMDTQVCENLQAQWEKAGIKVKIRQWEFQALMSEIKKGEFDMILLGWSPSTGDADQGLYPVFHSSQFPPNSNRAFYNNSQVDQLLENSKTEVDENKRMEMYKEAEQIIMDEAPWTFLYYPKQALTYRSNISGIEMLPTEHILFEKAVKR